MDLMKLLNRARRKKNFYIGTILGVDFHCSILFPVVAGIIFILTGWYGLVLTWVWFISILLHETAHLYFAQHLSASAGGITITPLGGFRNCKDVYQETGTFPALYFISGPLVSLLTAYALYTAAGANAPGIISDLSFDLFVFNLIYGTATILPAFPMDGGYAMRALAAKHRDFFTASFLIMKIGEFISVIIGAYAVICATLSIYGLMDVGVFGILFFVFMFSGAVYTYFYGYLELTQVSNTVFHQQQGDLMPDFDPPTSDSSMENLDREIDRLLEEGENILAGVNPETEASNSDALHPSADSDYLKSRVDRVLKKITTCGYEALTDKEKDILRRASESYRKRK